MSKIIPTNFTIAYECKYCKSLKTEKQMCSSKMCRTCKYQRRNDEKVKLCQKIYYEKNRERKILYQREYRKRQKMLKVNSMADQLVKLD